MSKKHHAHKDSGMLHNVKNNLWVAILIGVVGSIAYFAITAPKVSGTEIESQTGVHYHAHLDVTVDGVPVPLPSGLGLTPPESPMHVHEADNIIHMEFNGLVKKDDIRLGKFFDLWSQDWTPTSFMGHPIDATHTLIMRVNGVEVADYRQYLMRDKDQIELVYQSTAK